MIVRHRYASPNTVRYDSGLDRAFEQLTNSLFTTLPRTDGPRVDGAWHDDRYVLTVDLPGVPADAVSVDVTGNTLVLGAHTDTLEWERTMRLGGRLDPEKVSARHLDGRLTVEVGTVDEPEARRISIDTTPAPVPEAIDVASAEDQSTDTNDAD